MVAKSGSCILRLRQSGPNPTGIEEGWVRGSPHEQHFPSCWKDTLYWRRIEGSFTAAVRKDIALPMRDV